MTRQEFFDYLCQFNFEYQGDNNYDKMVKNPNRRVSLIESEEELNKIYRTCKELNLREITYNPSGSIMKAEENNFGAYSCEVVKNSKNNVIKGIILTILLYGYTFRFKYGHLQSKEDNTMTGIKAFKKFLNACKDLNIDLTKYAVDNGLEIKKEIEKPFIFNFVLGKRIEHVYHIDLNKAWPSSTCEEYPELEPAYKAIADKNIINPLNGFFQSKHCAYKYSNLAKAGINGCNKKIQELCTELDNEGFELLGINTDGIWYRDSFGRNKEYHGENEGTAMHQWKNDHKDCIWYAHSNGQYYYIEEGKFCVSARGYYQYEANKPREEWNEDDFFKAVNTLVTFYWDEEYGLIINKGE